MRSIRKYVDQPGMVMIFYSCAWSARITADPGKAARPEEETAWVT